MKSLVRAFLFLFFLCLFTSFGLIQAKDLTGSNPQLFPLYGVTLGKTMIEEINRTEEPVSGFIINEANGSYILNSIKFEYQDRILVALELTSDQAMPDDWKNLGFDWELSYADWTALLNKLGFSIKPLQVPTLLMGTNAPCFEAEFEAYVQPDYPTVFTFSFCQNQGTGISSGKVLHRIMARYSKDYAGLQSEGVLDNREEIHLSKRRRKALALSSITAEIDGLDHEKLELTTINQTATDNWKKVLVDEWEISGRKQFLDKLASMEQNGYSRVFNDLVKVLNENQDLTINELGVKYNFNNNTMRRLFLVKEKQAVIGSRALYAWDYSRMVMLCRIGYQTGFLSDVEAWDHLDKILTKVEGLYDSGEDFAANYILGRMFWAAGQGREIEEGNKALKAYAKIVYQDENAWRLSWNSRVQNDRNFKITSLVDALYFYSNNYYAWAKYVEGRQYYETEELSAALKLFEEALTLDEQCVDLWLDIATIYNRQGNYQKAAGAYYEYLSKRPEDYNAHIQLAEAYEKNNQTEAAIETYNKAIDINREKPEGFIGLGQVAVNSGNYDLAISYLRIAESLYVTNDEGIKYTLYLLGYSYYKAAKYDKALSYFIRTYGKYQDNKYFNYYIGICYLYNQTKTLAITYLEKAEKLGLEIPPEVKKLLGQAQQP